MGQKKKKDEKLSIIISHGLSICLAPGLFIVCKERRIMQRHIVNYILTESDICEKNSSCNQKKKSRGKKRPLTSSLRSNNMNEVIYRHIISSFLPCIGPTQYTQGQKRDASKRMMSIGKDTHYPVKTTPSLFSTYGVCIVAQISEWYIEKV